MGLKCPFWGHFGPPNKSKFRSLFIFSKRFYWFHISIASHASTFRGVEKKGLGGPIFGSLWAPKYPSFVIFSKSFHWFRISLGLHVHLRYFYRCVEYRPQGPNFRVILSPKIYHNSGFRSYSQTFSTGFAPFFSYMLIGGTFRCISMVCPRGPISGLRVKVAVELFRPSGFLFPWFLRVAISIHIFVFEK